MACLFLKGLEAVFWNNTRVRNTLMEYFEDKGNQISLRKLMDVAISDEKNPRTIYNTFPLLLIRDLGKKSFKATLHALTHTDFGEKFNREWEHRVAIHYVLFCR